MEKKHRKQAWLQVCLTLRTCAITAHFMNGGCVRGAIQRVFFIYLLYMTIADIVLLLKLYLVLTVLVGHTSSLRDGIATEH